MKRARSKSDMDLIDFAALGGGGIAAGVLQKGVVKFFPQAEQFSAAAPIIAGYLLNKYAKDKTMHFLGYGLISRGIGDAANKFGIGEDMISDTMDLSDSMESELADEIADAIESELAGGAELEADQDGSI